MLSSSPRGFCYAECFSDIHTNESRQTLAVLSSKPRNSCSHFKQPSILLAQDCQLWEWPRKASECSSPRDRVKDSLPEWVRAGPCCWPHRTGQASSSPNFDRSPCWFVVLLALLSHFLVARAMRQCRYSFPVQGYWLNKACRAAARSTCMHARSSSSIERRPQFGLLTRSWTWFCAFRTAFLLLWSLDTSYWGYFFRSPTCFQPDKYAYDSWQQPTPISLTTAQEPCRDSFRFFSQSTSALNTQ